MTTKFIFLNLTIIFFLSLVNQAYANQYDLNQTLNELWPLETHHYYLENDPALHLEFVISGSPFGTLAQKKITKFNLVFDPTQLSDSPNKQLLENLFSDSKNYSLNLNDVYFEPRSGEPQIEKIADSERPISIIEDSKPGSFIIRLKANLDFEIGKIELSNAKLTYIEVSAGAVRLVTKNTDPFNSGNNLLPMSSVIINARKGIQSNDSCPTGSCYKPAPRSSLREYFDKDVTFAIAALSDDMNLRIAWAENYQTNSIEVKQLLLEVGPNHGKQLRVKEELKLLSGITSLGIREKIRSLYQRAEFKTYRLKDLNSTPIVKINKDNSRTIILNVGEHILQFNSSLNDSPIKISLNEKMQSPIAIDIRNFQPTSLLASTKENLESSFNLTQEQEKIKNSPERRFQDYFTEKYFNNTRAQDERFKELYDMVLDYFKNQLADYIRSTNSNSNINKLSKTDLTEYFYTLKLPDNKILRELIMDKYFPIKNNDSMRVKDSKNKSSGFSFWNSIINHSDNSNNIKRAQFTKEVTTTDRESTIVSSNEADNYFLLKKIFNEYFLKGNQDLQETIQTQLRNEFLENTQMMCNELL